VTGVLRAVLFALAVTLAWPLSAPAQEVTVERLVSIALESAPELRAARGEVAVASGQVTQAGLRPNPSWLATQEMGNESTMVTTLGVEWPLNLFRRPARIEAAQRASDVVFRSVQDRERLLAAAVREQAGRVLAARRTLDVTNEALVAARRMRDLLDRRVTEGGVPKLEANLAAVEALRIEADSALATGELEAATIELKALVGLAADAPLVMADSLESVVRSAPPPRPAPATAVQERPDIREALARMNLADAQAEEARQAGRYDVAVTGAYTRMQFRFPQQGLNHLGVHVPIEGIFHTVTLGAQVKLPFFDRNQGALAAAQAERSRAEIVLDARRRTARAEVEAAEALDREAWKAVELYASTVRDLARQNVDVMLEAYDLGRFPLSDLLGQQRRYLEVEAGYTTVLLRAYAARAAVRRALGETR
jgi:cobalt-zinc-cadmium efflux system outer membrane protein